MAAIELRLPVPWGHIAAKAWGSQSAPPVLCLHGWLDNANSFDRLIPLLPRDFYYVAMDFGGHGLSSHYSPGVLYNAENFVSEPCNGIVFPSSATVLFSCTFPEMVDKLVLLDSVPFPLDTNELENLPTYRRNLIEHTLQQDEACRKPSYVYSQEEIQQRLLRTNTHVWEESMTILLQRGTSRVATGLVLNRDRRLTAPENHVEFISKERLAPFSKQLQAHLLLIKPSQGCNDVRRENHDKKEPIGFTIETLKSVLKERFQYVEVPGNHCVHINQPDHVAEVISSFLKSENRPPAEL